jgi:hypothetical protein
MGRKPWSDRLTVEECVALRISILRRAGVLASEPGSMFPASVPGLRLTIQMAGESRHLLLVRCRPTEPADAAVALSCVLRLTGTRCHFGGIRRWFICPVRGCGRRVGLLYLVPGASGFVCRSCGDLTYESRRHDNGSGRLADILAGLSDEEFLHTFPNSDVQTNLAWVQASTLRFKRLQPTAKFG